MSVPHDNHKAIVRTKSARQLSDTCAIFLHPSPSCMSILVSQWLDVGRSFVYRTTSTSREWSRSTSIETDPFTWPYINYTTLHRKISKFVFCRKRNITKIMRNAMIDVRPPRPRWTARFGLLWSWSVGAYWSLLRIVLISVGLRLIVSSIIDDQTSLWDIQDYASILPHTVVIIYLFVCLFICLFILYLLQT